MFNRAAFFPLKEDKDIEKQFAQSETKMMHYITYYRTLHALNTRNVRTVLSDQTVEHSCTE